MKKLIYVLVIVVAYFAYERFLIPELPASTARPVSAPMSVPGEVWQSGQQVSGGGKVLRILSDDNTGERHQRFVLKMNSGRILQVVHNIDLAPRIPSLKEGDFVLFHGQFEANAQGGVVHWTHDDSQGRHVAGWLEHNGKRYQ